MKASVNVGHQLRGTFPIVKQVMFASSPISHHTSEQQISSPLSGRPGPLPVVVLFCGATNLKGSQYPKRRVCNIAMLGIVTMALGRYLLFGHLDP